MKILILFLTSTLFSIPLERDFDTLMGKNTRVFRFVKNHEDKQNYSFLRQTFIDRLELPNQSQKSIPKTLHFIWLGPKPYPLDSIKKLNHWIQIHDGFDFKLWTDRPRHLNIEHLQEHIICEEDFEHCRHEFLQSDNPAEQSDLLRYEILYREGGIYLDHDVDCIKNITPLLQGHDFFATLSPLADPIVYPNAIRIRNSIIGFCQNHPLFENLFPLIRKRFSQIKNNGQNRQQILEIVTKRTFIPFHDCALTALRANYSTGIIYPVGFFTRVLKLDPLYAHESMDGLWWRDEQTYYEEHLDLRVRKLEKRLKYLGIATICLFILPLLKRRKYATSG